MASRKRKTTGFRTEEELADAVNEIVNDSDSDADNIPKLSSSEESESESANESDNESNISIPGPSHRQIDVTPTTGFSKNDRQPRIPPFTGNPVMLFAVENEADVMSYFDHYIPPELIEIIRYGILARMVCENSTGYICNLQIYDGKCGPLNETVGFLLKPYKGNGYHLYQDNYYNSVHQMNDFLQKLIRVCRTIRVNRGLPKDMIEEATKLKKGEVTFRRNQDILLISFQDKRLITMISTLHTADIIETTSR